MHSIIAIIRYILQYPSSGQSNRYQFCPEKYNRKFWNIIWCRNYERIQLILMHLQGLVKLTILPLRENIRYIKLNAQQCRIYRILFNDDIELDFQYADPTLDIYQENEHE